MLPVTLGLAPAGVSCRQAAAGGQQGRWSAGQVASRAGGSTAWSAQPGHRSGMAWQASRRPCVLLPGGMAQP